jgi:hypothetical protein
MAKKEEYSAKTHGHGHGHGHGVPNSPGVSHEPAAFQPATPEKFVWRPGKTPTTFEELNQELDEQLEALTTREMLKKAPTNKAEALEHLPALWQAARPFVAAIHGIPVLPTNAKTLLHALLIDLDHVCSG